MQALNWLLRCVTQPVCLHDLLWWFVTSLTPAETDVVCEEEPKVTKKLDDQVTIYNYLLQNLVLNTIIVGF